MTHPYISMLIHRERHSEMLAEASRQRLAHQARAVGRAARDERRALVPGKILSRAVR